MRLIDADAFKKVLSEHEMKHDKRRGFDEYSYGSASAYEYAGDLLDEQPTVELPHGEWIPVEERLPKPDKYVLVCSDEGYIEVAEGFISTEIEEFVWLTSGWRFGEVIAWMPLPEPYKKEGET